MKNTIFLILALFSMQTICFGQSNTVSGKFGALAIDRSNGFYYGWSHDYSTLPEAERKAIEECNNKGGNCTIVLSYSGTGCAAYRTIDGAAGSAYGWGLAKTKEEADAIASKECLKRSNGVLPTNFVWSCNSAGTSSFKEIYNASKEIEIPLKIGNQNWSNKNLDVSTFRNGDPIPQARNHQEWQDLSYVGEPAWCYYNFDPENGKKYGKLYNWFAVSDPRGIAPIGWHVPSKAEFETLLNFAGGQTEASSKLRSKTGWLNNKNGNDDFGFNLLPNGYCGEYVASGFSWIGERPILWTSSGDGPYRAYYLNFNTEKDYLYISAWSKGLGFGVRCIKD